MPLDPACSRVEPLGGQERRAQLMVGRFWEAGQAGRLETKDLAKQGSETGTAGPERGGWWKGGGGGLPPADAA